MCLRARRAAREPLFGLLIEIAFTAPSRNGSSPRRSAGASPRNASGSAESIPMGTSSPQSPNEKTLSTCLSLLIRKQGCGTLREHHNVHLFGEYPHDLAGSFRFSPIARPRPHSPPGDALASSWRPLLTAAHDAAPRSCLSNLPPCMQTGPWPLNVGTQEQEQEQERAQRTAVRRPSC
jgi:hypothetical protein